MNTNDSWLSPVPKKNLSRVVTDKITDALVSGQIKPGDYLPSENQLAESMNVGKSSVREATKMLEAVGVVEIVKGHGCRVRTNIDANALNPLAYQLILQSHTTHEKLVEFRQIIESAASCLAVKAISDEEIMTLRAVSYTHLDVYKRQLLISADFDEILKLSDRIAVMFEGKIVNTYSGDNPPVKEISLAMSGKQ